MVEVPVYLSTGEVVKLLDNEFEPWDQAMVRNLLRKMKCDVKLGGRLYASTDKMREAMPDLYQRILVKIEEKALNGKAHR